MQDSAHDSKGSTADEVALDRRTADAQARFTAGKAQVGAAGRASRILGRPGRHRA